MATQTVQPGASTAQETSLTIYLYSDDDIYSPLGSVTYQQSDTVLDIKRRVQAQLHYPTESQCLVLRSRVPNTPIQQLGDTGRPSDTDGTPSIRVDLANATKPVAGGTSYQEEHKTQVSDSNNRLVALDADQTARTSVGQYYSEEALRHGSTNIPIASNGVQGARLRGESKLRVGDQFGGSLW
ncbi:hypothetical protein FPSE_00724 [Fusarium pseudograminearum CS3096]|uniref:Ubiquitin-like domain-containing protein n=1 Tax=Fusarium pseudograminearum (strain CS3096) TaxID=1028729 RepID=K3VW46_FUSPC|nr:hypothetical protein FPSE_00724 [Fusarium pseudograminearum CS3096]EKJ79123.1 hypothetical protein FPSE_00724 [Fusarium pseudograminearum CS3096]